MILTVDFDGFDVLTAGFDVFDDFDRRFCLLKTLLSGNSPPTRRIP